VPVEVARRRGVRHDVQADDPRLAAAQLERMVGGDAQEPGPQGTLVADRAGLSKAVRSVSTTTSSASARSRVIR